MLTVKVITFKAREIAEELIFEASQVRMGEVPNATSGHRSVWCDVPDGDQIIYDLRSPTAPPACERETIMYVMNRNGSTVSTFHL